MTCPPLLTRVVTSLVVGSMLSVGGIAATNAQADSSTPRQIQVSGVSLPASALAAPAAKKSPSLTIKSPVGTCRTRRKEIQAPSDRDQFCSYRRTMVGHSHPDAGDPGYLHRVSAAVRKGTVVSYQGKLYKVAWKKSYKKSKLPNKFFSKRGTDRYLITCDTHSGYRNHHAIKNLVIRFVRI